MKYITLTTDFGMQDGYAGVLRGVIWSIAPGAQVADLSHNVGPQNILQGALILKQHGSYFPAGTVHIGVVDPAVGTTRRPIAARLGKHYFTGPDNGLCSLLLEAAEAAGEAVEIVHLNQRTFWLAEPSNVFHGRDIFAPTAAHIINGIELAALGTRIDDPIRLRIPEPVQDGNRWNAQVLYIDHFGNIILNIRREDLEPVSGLEIELGGMQIKKFVHAYGEGFPGELVALFGSSGYLEMAEVDGSAARRLGAATGDAAFVYAESIQIA